MLPWWLAALGIPVGAAVIVLAMRIAGRRERDAAAPGPRPEPEAAADDR